jgi:hypothetical protein
MSLAYKAHASITPKILPRFLKSQLESARERKSQPSPLTQR